jgi:hypothetical protein
VFKKRTKIGIPSSNKIHSLAQEMLARSLLHAQEMPKRADNNFSEQQHVETFELWSILLVLILNVQLRSIFDVPTSNDVMDLIIDDYCQEIKQELKFSNQNMVIFRRKLVEGVVHYGKFTKHLFPDGEGNTSGTLVFEISTALSDLLNYPSAYVEVPTNAVNDASRLVKILKDT